MTGLQVTSLPPTVAQAYEKPVQEVLLFFLSQKDAIGEKGQEIWPGLTELMQELGCVSSTVA